MKLLTAIWLGLGAIAAAQNNTVITVSVGENDKLLFRPTVVYANPGETVEFVYYPQNHSVVQGSLDSPCLPLDGGFYSGYVPSAGGEAANAFVITVTDRNPIYYYCSQGRHCQAGMVGVVNPPLNNSGSQFAYAQAAAQAPRNVPGPNGVTGGQLISLSGNSSTPANVSATVSSVAPLSTAANSTEGGASGTSTSVISAGSPATTTGSSGPSGTGSAPATTSSAASAAHGLVASGMLGGLGLLAWLGGVV